MKNKRTDYIVTDITGQMLIENEQKKTRASVIDKYITCRKEKNITQTELAQRTGISQPNITRFESGNYNPSLEMLVRIANAMDMHISIELKEKE